VSTGIFEEDKKQKVMTMEEYRNETARYDTTFYYPPNMLVLRYDTKWRKSLHSSDSFPGHTKEKAQMDELSE
jgi:hypothetical protein